MGEGKPGILLLDVCLPDENGFALCRRIHGIAGLENVPVIFVSGFDDLESKLEGYDAGGIDFISKPVNLIELTRKVDAAQRICLEHRSLYKRAVESDTLSSLVLSNLDEFAVLIKFLRAQNTSDTPRAVADELAALMRAYQLQSAIQVRMGNDELTISHHGDNWPLDVSVIKHVRKMGRIFEFKRQAAYNFEHVTVLVSNVPIDDPDLCGRIRDNLAIAGESANAKLASLSTREENRQARQAVGSLIAELKAAVTSYEKKYNLARYRGSSLTVDLQNRLMSAFAALGMTLQQENEILDVVTSMAEELADVYDFSSDMQETLGGISDRLSSILSIVIPAMPVIKSFEKKHEAPSVAVRTMTGVDLF